MYKIGKTLSFFIKHFETPLIMSSTCDIESQVKSKTAVSRHLPGSDLFLQLLAVNKPRFGVVEAAGGVGLEVAGSEDGLHVLELPRLGGDILEQSCKIETNKCVFSGLFYKHVFNT